MALPKLKLPLLEVELPSSKKKINLRPFTVKEEKILLIAAETKNQQDVLNALIQVVNNCIVEDIDIHQLSLIDIQYTFIKLRIVSVGNTTEIRVKDPETEKYYETQVNLENIEVVWPEKQVSNTIMLTDEVGVTLRHPTFELAKKDKLTTEEMIINCLVNIFDQQDVYDIKDQSREEVQLFVESLTAPQALKMKAFFENAPKLQCEITYTTDEDEQKSMIVENINDFFY